MLFRSAGIVPEIQAAAFKPKLDRQLRLRAIRRLQTAKAKPDPEPPAPKKSGRSRKAKAT